MNNLIIGKSPLRPLLDTSLNVLVPANFCGAQLYQETAFSPTATIRNARPWATLTGGIGCNWNDIETAKGVFSWTAFDAAFSHVAAVPMLYFTLGRTPAWAGPAINEAPAVTQDYADMCTALATRARDTHGRTGVLWDLWNEIDYTVSWNGSPSTLGPLAKAGAAAIRAVDPTAIILSPSIVFTTASRVTNLTTALAVSDGAAGTLKDHIDGVSIHYYAQDKLAQWYDTAMQWAQIVAMKSALAVAGVGSLPIHVNESGVDVATKVYSKADQATLQLRAMALCAAAGFKGYCAYVYDTTPASFGNVSDYIPQWNAVAERLNGGRITRLVIESDQSVTLTVDGSELKI